MRVIIIECNIFNYSNKHNIIQSKPGFSGEKLNTKKLKITCDHMAKIRILFLK